MKSLDDKQIARVRIACAQYVSHNENDDERIGAVVAAQLSDIPRSRAYCCAVHSLKQRREEWRRRFVPR